MQGQEIFLPKMKEFRIADIAKKICPGSELKVIGIRKGEKLREDLMTDEEKTYAKDMGKYWVIGGAG
jgi:FlaA1/EpsC-like NDP-sugar epimerase